MEWNQTRHGTGVIEIKCPSTGEEKSLEEYASLQNDVVLDENGNLEVINCEEIHPGSDAIGPYKGRFW